MIEMTNSVLLKVNDINDIVKLHHTISTFSGEANLVKGRYKCNAKSLMGLLAIDTSEPTKLEFDISYTQEILDLMKDFIYKKLE